MPVARNVAGMDDVGGPEAWFHSLPVVTKGWFAASVICTLAGNMGVVQPYTLLFNWPAIRYQFEVWRLVTPFFFIGAFSFRTLILCYQLVTYSQRYEMGPFNTGAGGGSADYAFMMMFHAVLMNLICLFVTGPMLIASAMVSSVVYVWSKREPNAPVSIFGVPFKAAHLPFVLVGLSLVMGNSIVDGVVGIAVGHTYYFLVDIVPALHGKDILHTPDFLINYFGTGVYIPPTPTATQQAWAAPGRVNPPTDAARPASRGYNWGSGQALGSS
mmetsp:Transcript_3812/g.5188  ORF Transcript_3812/g.5188 Transcript_3812/m.5188 type:complete len:271 (-) Transcript_3812:380-1192(-)|eukprot:CAMPEP_0116056632 /NCGR_PEP_ID=MMETSP0322-20121206/4132_1 /TAXON_ID=163516 /ORGANISM="Leptocylindrus danicus var. apora, Strain B651" /LENGTH=270 /DNA_ID=CAMNT_0003540491 /DNA_START=107 /DNA_END=919 /DNA_ORIENTATION=-